MLQIMINCYIFLFTIIFSFLNHPLSMGVILLIQTFLISLTTGLMAQSYWFSYILFLIFIGGMLILFLYMTSISSNEKFSLSQKLFFILFFFIFFIFLLSIFIDYQYLNFSKMVESLNFGILSMTNKENSLNLKKLYNPSTNLITLFLVIYLFITMVISVKITNFFSGPLRPLFN